MDGSFQLYKKSPFQFNNTPFILCAPAATTFTGKLSAYVKSELNKLDKFYNVGENPKPYPSNPVNGEENVFYFSINYTHFINLLKDVPIATETRNAALALNYLLSELKRYNLLQYKYAPFSYNIDTNGAATDPYNDGVEVFSYFYDVLQIDIVPPSEEDLKARSTDPKPGNGNTVKGFAEVITIRLIVRRNKMLEAYANGDFDEENAPTICGGAIVEASRGFIKGRIPNARFSAYKAIQPAEGSGEGYKSGFFERISPDYNDKFYCLIVGTKKMTGGNLGERTAVFVTATYNSDNKATAKYAGSYNIDLTMSQLGAAKEIKESTANATNTFSFTPYAVYVVPQGCFLGDPTIIQDKAGDLWVKNEIITEVGASVPVVELQQRIYTPYTIGRPVASFETLTVGTARTRVKLKNLLVSEAKNDAATKGIETENIEYNAELNNVGIETKITKGSRNGVKIILHVGNAEYDITNDFAGALSATNISNAQIQAEATARATNFVQQGAGVVLGGAAIIGGAVTGNIPAVVAGVSSAAGSVSGIIQNVQREAPRQTATQTGTPDGLENIIKFDGVYFETFSAWNAEEIKRVKKYKTTFENATNITIIGRKAVGTEDREELTTAGAIISAGSTAEEVKTQITNKLNSGSVICYSVEQLKIETGTD